METSAVEQYREGGNDPVLCSSAPEGRGVGVPVALDASPAPGRSVSPMARQDPLAYLPCSTIDRYERRESIFFPGQQATSVYLVLEGKVKILRLEYAPVVVDIYQSDELFGESAFAGPALRMEQAVAMEPTTVMSWPAEEIETIAASRPEFAFALIRLVVRRSFELADRIESLSREGTEQRLIRTLVRFAGRFGKEAGDGTVRIEAFTQEFLSQYIGTTRELVTQHMSRLRRDGFIRYTRHGIFLQPHALTVWQAAQSTRSLTQSAA